MKVHMHRQELIRLRHKAGLTQAQCAEIAGVCRQTWIRYEDGSNRVAHRVAAMAKEGFPPRQAASPADLETQPGPPAPPVQPQAAPPPPCLARRLLSL